MKRNYDDPPSNFAFNFNLRHYNAACERLCFLTTRNDIAEGPVLISGGGDGNLRVWLTQRGGD